MTTSDVYDTLGWMTQQVSPDSGTTNYTSDHAGNLETKTDARNITATTTCTEPAADGHVSDDG